MKKIYLIASAFIFILKVSAQNNLQPPVIIETVVDDATEETDQPDEVIYDLIEAPEDMEETVQITGETEEAPLSEVHTLPDHLLNHPYIRYQHQINVAGEAEAYPWISADALRMYFTKGNTMYMSLRTSRYEDFGKAAMVELDKHGSFNSGWLTNNELKMYCTNGSSIWIYERNNTSEAFRYLKSIDVKNYASGFISAASFTPDMKTMMVYNSHEGQKLLFFEMANEGTVVLSHNKTLELQYGEIAVGQFSKDGKWIYFSVDNDPDWAIYKLPLAYVDQPESAMQEVLRLSGVRIGKPSISYDETFLCFNATAQNLWQDNEIMVVDLNNLSYMPQDTMVFALHPADVQVAENYKPKAIITIPNTAVTQFSSSDFELKMTRIYPNPTTEKVTAEYKLPVNCTVAELIMQDYQGKEILRKKLNHETNSTGFSMTEIGCAKGTYFVWINTELGNTTPVKLVYR